MLRKQHGVTSPLSQRRQVHAQDIQPEKQILAKRFRLNQPVDIPVRRGHNSDVRIAKLRCSQWSVFFLLN